MSIFLSRIRSSLVRKSSLIFFLLQGVVLITIVLIHLIYASSYILYSALIFLFLEALVFIFFVSLLTRSINEILGSQDTLSRTLFKSTRNIINNISHEWRTPLNGIMGFTDELYRIETDPRKKEALTEIKLNSQRLYNMSKKLIDFSSIETGLYKVECRYQDPGSLLHTLKNKFEESASAKNLKLQIYSEIPDSTKILFDNNSVFEILSMLIENSIKFTKSGSVTVSAEYKNKNLIFSVADTGIGIEENKKKIVFELYRQGNSDMDREFEGIGMGLSLASKLVELLDGSIRIEDNKPQGTIISVRFKSDSQEAGKGPGRDGKLLGTRKMNDEQKKILGEAVEDLKSVVKVFNPARIRKIAEELLEKDSCFQDLSEKLNETARSFDEAGLASIVEEMLEDIEL